MEDECGRIRKGKIVVSKIRLITCICMAGPLCLALFVLVTMHGVPEEQKAALPRHSAAQEVLTSEADKDEASAVSEALKIIADRERDGVYIPGLALQEAALHESDGDAGAALLAAFRELLWAYILLPVDDEHALDKEQLLERIAGAAALYPDNEQLCTVHNALASYIKEDWQHAADLLASCIHEDDEPDAFVHFLHLSCLLEAGHDDESLRRSFALLRGRYESFPLYWFYAARFGSRRLEAAEHCIALSPKGPYAQGARSILAELSGLEASDAEHLRIRAEIENAIEKSLSAKDPSLLHVLFPLLALPDNPFTLYALSSFRVLSEAHEYSLFFMDQSKQSSGRLAERLRYASGV